jgi:hypothetical protein
MKYTIPANRGIAKMRDMIMTDMVGSKPKCDFFLQKYIFLTFSIWKKEYFCPLIHHLE